MLPTVLLPDNSGSNREVNGVGGSGSAADELGLRNRTAFTVQRSIPLFPPGPLGEGRCPQRAGAARIGPDTKKASPEERSVPGRTTACKG